MRRVGAAFHAAEAGHDAAHDLHDVLTRPVRTSGSSALPHGAEIRVGRLVVTRAGRTVDLDVCVGMRPGHVVVVQGPSGTGKSTLLDAIRGRVDTAPGAVSIGGVALHDLDRDAWDAAVIAVPQRPQPLLPTVADEVRGATAASDGCVATALADVDLVGRGSTSPAELSGGQLRRVQVARAVTAVRHGTARIVLADEPTAQLDPTNADAVRSVLVDLARSAGATVVVASHDRRWAAVADEIVDLSAGPVAVTPDGAHNAGSRDPDTVLTTTCEAGATRPIAPGPDGPPLSTAGLDDDLSGRGVPAMLVAVVRPFRARLAVAALLAIATEVCTVGLAGAAAWLIVRASEQPPLATLAVAVTCVRAFGIGKGVLRYAERLASHDVGFRALGSIRARIVERVAAVAPLPGWERGEVIRRTVDDVDQLLELIVRIIVPWCAYVVVSGAATFVMIILDPAAGAVVAAAVVAVGVVLPIGVFHHQRRVGGQLVGARTVLFSRVLDVTDRIDLLSGAGLLGAARAQMADAAARVERLESSRQHERAVTRALLAAAPTCAVAGVLAVIGPTTTLAAPVVGVLVLWPLAVVELVGAVSDGARQLPEIAAAVERVHLLQSIAPAASGPPLEASPAPAVLVERMWARWPGAPTPSGPYELSLAPGGRAALAGPSGSGKSTLAASMVRFCPIVGGEYRLDDADAAVSDADDVRERVLWVSQHPWIGDSTVRANLRIGAPEATDEELRTVLATVELERWLDGLPEGLDTWVGRGGVAVSGGEAHRLAIARALLARHPVVVLDEPVSHLDAEMGQRVLGLVDTELGGRSLLLLDHGTPTSPGRHLYARPA